jgi:hypothetical protein
MTTELVATDWVAGIWIQFLCSEGASNFTVQVEQDAAVDGAQGCLVRGVGIAAERQVAESRRANTT